MSRSKLLANRLIAHHSNKQQRFRTPPVVGLSYTHFLHCERDGLKAEERIIPGAVSICSAPQRRGARWKSAWKEAGLWYANSDLTWLRWPISQRVRWIPQAPSLNCKLLMPDSTGAIKSRPLQDSLRSQTNKRMNAVCSEKPVERSNQIVSDLHLQTKSLQFESLQFSLI